MKKEILTAASFYSQKHFFNNMFSTLPNEIQKESTIICVTTAEKIHGIFSIGFYDDGSIFLEASGNEDDFDYDEIGAALEIDKLKREKKDLFNSLTLWYKVFINKNR